MNDIDALELVRVTLEMNGKRYSFCRAPDSMIPAEIAAALRALGITGDALFARIRQDLDRGLVDEARARLNFVDELMAGAEKINPANKDITR